MPRTAQSPEQRSESAQAIHDKARMIFGTVDTVRTVTGEPLAIVTLGTGQRLAVKSSRDLEALKAARALLDINGADAS